MKKVILWGFVFILTFAAFVALFYFGRAKFWPAPAGEDRTEQVAQPQIAHSTDDSLTAIKMDSLIQVTEQLSRQQAGYLKEKQEYEKIIAFQKGQIEVLSAKGDSLAKKMDLLKVQETRISDVTKTLGAMKIAELEPILKKLPDEALQILYTKAKTRDKEKIFRAMPPDRAGRLLNEMAQTLIN